MSEHAIHWEFDDGCVTATAVCHAAPDADCHLTSVTCECERWGDIQRRDDGTIWHHIEDYGDSIEPVWHEVKPMDDCNVCLFINESGCVEELAVRGTRIDLGETPIRPVWLDDGCDWEPTTTPADLRAEVNKLANLAAEHLSCTGCPTPWWLNNWLFVVATNGNPTQRFGGAK